MVLAQVGPYFSSDNSLTLEIMTGIFVVAVIVAALWAGSRIVKI